MPMSLQGLRAWIGEVERKLGARTRVFLALAAIAIGTGGAGIYLALDAREDAVSEGDVQALQERLEGQIGAAGAAGGADLTQLEADVDALQAEVAELRSKIEASGQAGKDAGAAGASNEQGGGADSGGGESSGDDGASAEGADGGKARLRELLEDAQKKSEGSDEGR